MADYIPLFLDWARSTDGLSEAEKGRLVDAMVAYANGEDWQNLVRGNEKFVLNVFRGQIDRHMEMLKTNATNGKRGGRPKKTGGFEVETGGFETETGGFDEKANKSKSKSKSNSNSKSEEDMCAQSAPRASRRFTPPTVAEVAAYCAEKGYAIDAERFVTYYGVNGWKQGKGKPIVDWKAAVRYWTMNGYSKPEGGVARGADPEPAPEDLFAGMSDEDIALAEQIANDGEHWG